MNRSRWDDINRARKILRLQERATLGQIKSAFRKLSKERHPDLNGDDTDKKAAEKMQQLIEAYSILMDYCNEYRFPLQPDLTEEKDDEDWWMDRFGQDPLWGKGGDSF